MKTAIVHPVQRPEIRRCTGFRPVGQFGDRRSRMTLRSVIQKTAIDTPMEARSIFAGLENMLRRSRNGDVFASTCVSPVPAFPGFWAWLSSHSISATPASGFCPLAGATPSIGNSGGPDYFFVSYPSENNKLAKRDLIQSVVTSRAETHSEVAGADRHLICEHGITFPGVPINPNLYTMHA